MWEHKANTGSKDPEKWKENMKQLCEFNTVEGFWQYFNHLPKPSEVFFDGESRKKVTELVQQGEENNSGLDDGEKMVEEYSLFKKGIEPEWGDAQNVNGGEWFCRQFFEAEVLDLFWTNLVMACIGETIEDAIDKDSKGTFQSYINGARVVDKSRNFPLYKIEIWLNTRDPIIREQIKDKLIDVLTDGQVAPSRKMQPKFDWKDHSV
jgi:translation initiation factor 4E